MQPQLSETAEVTSSEEAVFRGAMWQTCNGHGALKQLLLAPGRRVQAALLRGRPRQRRARLIVGAALGPDRPHLERGHLRHQPSFPSSQDVFGHHAA